MFAADIRLPCRFQVNENLISYVAGDLFPDLEISALETLRLAEEVEREMLGHLTAGRKVSLWEVVAEVLLRGVAPRA